MNKSLIFCPIHQEIYLVYGCKLNIVSNPDLYFIVAPHSVQANFIKIPEISCATIEIDVFDNRP